MRGRALVSPPHFFLYVSQYARSTQSAVAVLGQMTALVVFAKPLDAGLLELQFTGFNLNSTSAHDAVVPRGPSRIGIGNPCPNGSLFVDEADAPSRAKDRRSKRVIPA
jgi:hypothetical protein